MHRQYVGTTLCGLICVYHNYPATHIQQSDLRLRDPRDKRVIPARLEPEQQLRKCTLQATPTGASGSYGAEGKCNSDSSILAGPTVVPDTTKYARSTSIQDTQQPKCYVKNGTHSRATEKPLVAYICLEDQWRNKLRGLSWSSSTLKQYNSYVKRFYDYCMENGHVFPCMDECVLATFFCVAADSSSRPK